MQPSSAACAQAGDERVCTDHQPVGAAAAATVSAMTTSEIVDRFQLDRATFDDIVDHANSDVPYEVCGLLGIAEGLVKRHWRIRNAERSMTYYAMDSRELLGAMREIEDNDWDLAIYHSHTHTEAYPSATDIRIAAYPEAVYLIVSLQHHGRPEIRAFDIVDGNVRERPVEVAEPQGADSGESAASHSR